jgi:hypothetical protein
VPANAAIKRKAVESTHHQLRHADSAAYCLVANISSLPVLSRATFYYFATDVDKDLNFFAVVGVLKSFAVIDAAAATS